jgi:hypothetical protein
MAGAGQIGPLDDRTACKDSQGVVVHDAFPVEQLLMVADGCLASVYHRRAKKDKC